MKMKKLIALLLILALCCALLSVTALAGRIQTPEDAFIYDETSADSVRVTVTVSNDGAPIIGADENATVLAGITVDVPYFDLKLYGLETLYRYPTYDVDGKPTYDTTQPVVKRPTALHLYIYLLERYYLGYAEADCCKGLEDPPTWDRGATVFPNRTKVDPNMGTKVYDIAGGVFGDKKDSEDIAGLFLTGSPQSLYMKNFWGHDENLMYYRNHAYPYWYTGVGSTCEYALLSDDDSIDIAMFTDWQFWTHGAFACFDKETYEARTGEPIAVQTLKYATQSVSDGGSDSFLPAAGLTLEVYDAAYWTEQSNDTFELTCTDEETAAYSLTFSKPGTYYLVAHDPIWGKDGAATAPAVARITVTGDELSTGLQSAQLTAGEDGTARVTVNFAENADGTTLLAAAFRAGRLVSLDFREIRPGRLTVTLPAQPGDTVKLFRLDAYAGTPLEAAYTSILNG